VNGLALLSLGFLLPLCADDPIKVNFPTLSSFEYEEGMELPAEVTRLDLQRVEVSGFMAREDGGTGPTDMFMLIDEACGCEGLPKMNEVIFCALPEGEEIDVQPGLIKVTGTLYVGEEIEDGVVISLYYLEVESVDRW
jgi:hypothetical protein